MLNDAGESVSQGKSGINRQLVSFLAQIAVIFSIVCVALINLTLNPEGLNKELWVALLSSSVGCLLPNPKFKKP